MKEPQNTSLSPKTKKTIHVVAAILIQDGRLLATQRGYGLWKDWWEFPGGKVEQGEEPREALRREMQEELAVDIEAGKLVASVEYDYPDFHLSMLCFRCRVVAGRLTLLEHEAARWLSQEELDAVRWLPADVEVIRQLDLQAPF